MSDFYKKANTLLEKIEDLDFGEYNEFGDWINEKYVRKILTDKNLEDLRQIFPTLSNDKKEGIKKLLSSSFKDVVERLLKYSELPPNKLKNAIYNILGFGGMSLLNKIKGIELPYTEELMKLAIEVVKNEIPFIKAHTSALDRFKFKLTLNDEVSTEDMQFEAPGEEKEDFGDDFSGQLIADLRADEKKIENQKRSLSNLVNHGGALVGMDYYKLVLPEIAKIVEEPVEKLTQLYGYLTAIGDLGYWVMPEGSESAAIGSSSFEESEDNEVTIYASAYTFPYLLHEIVKGLLGYVKQIQPGAERFNSTETIADERPNLMIGKQATKQLFGNMDQSKFLDMLTMLITDDYDSVEELRTLIQQLQMDNNLRQKLYNNYMKRINEADQEEEKYDDGYNDDEDNDKYLH